MAPTREKECRGRGRFGRGNICAAAVCGSLLHWVGPKDQGLMACAGATRDYRCWNSIALNAEVAASNLASAILGRGPKATGSR
jgi:hypothetical protein